jgi:protein arginine kinase activator
MNCQRCKKARATVHLTDCGEGEARERHLCDACAEQEGLTLKQSLPVASFLEQFVKHTQGLKVQNIAKLACPDCGMTFAEFRQNGLLGCPNDYTVFESFLLPLLERAHDGASHHAGLAPGAGADGRGATAPAGESIKLSHLRRELEQAVANEKYELAARLRDQIRASQHESD